jgi:hypothetical protein
VHPTLRSAAVRQIPYNSGILPVNGKYRTIPCMAQMTSRLELRLSPDTLDRIERWRRRQAVPPTKAAAIRHIVELGLAEAEKGARHPGGDSGSSSSSKPGSKSGPSRVPRAKKPPPERKAEPAEARSKLEQIRALREQSTR